ncbi:recombinase RecT [Persephonella sp.]|uniref:recombinase RecT n=1 Tax=Persephonella sp. TaxID=2060922 RepID=UPI00260B22EB|nr:recombinase RecT [Persephonella sp.]
MNEKAIELKVKNFLESFKNKDIYNYAITLSPVFKEPERYIDYRKQLAQLLIAVPKLTEYDPKSLIFATAKAYEQGYSFDPKDAEAYFIPYGKEIQFQKGYRGILKDLMKRPDVVDVIADVVYEDDDIEIDKDPHGRLILKRHKSNPFKRSKDKIIGAYAFVYYKVDGKIVSNGVAMSAEEIEEDFRSLSKADKSMGKNSFWEKWKADMYKKTVIKQLRKILPPLPEEKIDFYHETSRKEEPEISDERKELIKAFNKAYTESGLTAQELKSIIYTRYFVNEPAELTDEQLTEITQLLREKGKSLLEATVLIGAKEQKELEELFVEKQLNDEQQAKVYEYLGIEDDKIPSYEEYTWIKNFLSQNEREQILAAIGWKEKKIDQKTLEETLETV